MKVVKFIVKLLVWAVVLVVAIVLTLPLWIGPVVKTTANSFGPKFTQTRVHLGDFGLNFYTGNFHMGDLQVANPAGFSAEQAVTLGTLQVELDPLSVASDVIHIRLIRIQDVFVSYVSKDGVNNFEQLMINAGVKKTEGEDAAAKAETAQPAEPTESKPGKKVIIDRFELSGVLVQLGPIPLPLPPLTLTDIGKKSNGATFEEAWQQIAAAVMNSVGALGDGLKALGGALGDGAVQLSDGAFKAVDSVGEGAKAVGDGVGKTADALGEGAKAVGDGVGKTANALGEGAKALGDGVGKTANALGDGAKAVGDGVKAVGDGAAKALDSIKKLW